LIYIKFDLVFPLADMITVGDSWQSDKSILDKKKVAIAMHCNLRASNPR